jgi:hypothetical protein
LSIAHVEGGMDKTGLMKTYPMIVDDNKDALPLVGASSWLMVAYDWSSDREMKWWIVDDNKAKTD